MSKINKNKIFIILSIILGLLFFFGIFFTTDLTKKTIKKLLPENLKPTMKELVLFYNHKIRKNLILKKNKKINYISIYENKYSITNYQNNFFKTNGPKSYIALNNNYLFLITGTGIILKTDLKKISNDKLKLSNVSNNLNKIFGFKYMSKYNYFITGIFIYDGDIYLSYTNEVTKNCFNTSILKGKINVKKIIFEGFFTPQECINIKNEYGEFNLGNAGGALSKFTNNSILLSVGDYGYRTHAQNQKNNFGKILSINLKTKNKKIISLGHRNVQGLYYDKKSNVIISSEHGPEGGDEININQYNLNNIKNFGWPISSYGEHYGGKNEPNNKKKYITAPLNKSHKKFGFIEPIKNFTPSVAPSRILLIDKDFIYAENKQFFLSTLGYPSKIKQGHMSLHYIVVDDGFKIIDHKTFPIKERTRDMIYSKKYNKIFFFFESSGSIGLLEKINN